MLIDCVNFVLLILKQHLLPVHCFTIKQAGRMVIKRKAFSNYTLFCTFAALILQFFLYFYMHKSLPLRQQTLSRLFHQVHLSSSISLFYFFRWVVACYHPLNFTRIKPFLIIFCNDLLSLSRTQSCLCPYSINLPCCHTLASCSHNETHTLVSCLSPILPAQGKLACSS